jgi:hypothetical protein
MATDIRLKEELPSITDQLVDTYTECSRLNHLAHEPLPNRDAVAEIVADLMEVLYPGYGKRQNLHIGNIGYYVGSLVDVDFDRVALGGQSDGAGYALTMGLAYGDTFNHLIILAGGGLIEPIRRQGKPKIFMAQGVKDTTMPPDVSGRKNYKLLKDDYDVTYREHEGGHGTPLEITREAVLWFLGKGVKPQ